MLSSRSDLETVIKNSNPNLKGISKGVHIIRYADDMIITGRTKELVINNKKILVKFLAERGLELNETKTLLRKFKNCIIHIIPVKQLTCDLAALKQKRKLIL